MITVLSVRPTIINTDWVGRRGILRSPSLTSTGVAQRQKADVQHDRHDSGGKADGDLAEVNKERVSMEVVRILGNKGKHGDTGSR